MDERPSSSTIRLDNLWLPYCQMKTAVEPLEVVSTSEVYLQLADGRLLIDGIASWWTACHGYNHPHIIASVLDQLQRMPHVMLGGLIHQPAQRLAERLAALLPGDLNRVFFCDSGSVAVEVALKMAVQYWLNQGRREAHRFVSFRNAYHGDTTGAMSVCDPIDSMHAHFKGFLLEQFPLPLPASEAELQEFEMFLRRKRSVLAGVIIEPLAQMATGMHFHSPSTLQRIVETCQKYELLVIADEIATGFGRTGSLFAIEQAKVVPDIVCLGKALTGGVMTMAATIASDRVFSQFYTDQSEHAFMHGPTYMGNPLACAAANASLDLFEREPRFASVAAIAKQFDLATEAVRGLPGVVAARSLGAIFAIEFDACLPALETRDFFVSRGIWLRPIGNVLYACPPLTIQPRELATVVDAMMQFAKERSTASGR